ncbi:MAG TPA: hypothetical protein VHA80_02530 [Solirubrobacterales bacterium]|jgi:hypothetical protein|nr:hypothetical protein [Solirubrobacterales bacterium]
METDRSASRLKEILGWASLGLAAGLLGAPSRVARLIGFPDDARSSALLRAVGLREMLAYVLIERTGPEDAGPLWVRTGGDAIDLALIGASSRRGEADRGRLAVAAANVGAIAALDAYAAMRLGRSTGAANPAAPAEDLAEDPAGEPPEPLRGIEGG